MNKIFSRKLISKLKKHCHGTFNHCFNVALICAKTSKKLGLKNTRLLKNAAMMHDIGKTKNPRDGGGP